MGMRITLQYTSFRFTYWAVGLFLSTLSAVFGSQAAAAGSAHQFEFISIEGQPLKMSDFSGKAILLVNTASFCGFTHQYKDLQALWEKYRDRGFVVLGVPSNDFGRQEPGSSTEIKEFCDVQYGIDFPMTEKVVVRGDEAHPLYRWLKGSLGAARAPKWNFHKYLIGPDGRAISAFATHVSPDDNALLTAIEAVLPATR